MDYVRLCKISSVYWSVVGWEQSCFWMANLWRAWRQSNRPWFILRPVIFALSNFIVPSSSGGFLLDTWVDETHYRDIRAIMSCLWMQRQLSAGIYQFMVEPWLNLTEYYPEFLSPCVFLINAPRDRQNFSEIAPLRSTLPTDSCNSSIHHLPMSWRAMSACLLPRQTCQGIKQIFF